MPSPVNNVSRMNANDSGEHTADDSSSFSSPNIGSPHAVRFLWESNNSYRRIGKTPFKLHDNDTSRLTIKLKDTEGKLHTFTFPDANHPQFDNPKWVAAANRWFTKTLEQNLTGEPKKRQTRPQWTVQEKHYLKAIILEVLSHKNLGERISQTEWEQIAEKQNLRFAGRLIRIGQGFVPAKSKEIAVRSGWGLTALQVKPFESRTATAIQSTLKSWKELKDIIKNGETNNARRSSKRKSMQLDDDDDDESDEDSVSNRRVKIKVMAHGAKSTSELPERRVTSGLQHGKELHHNTDTADDVFPRDRLRVSEDRTSIRDVSRDGRANYSYYGQDIAYDDNRRKEISLGGNGVGHYLAADILGGLGHDDMLTGSHPSDSRVICKPFEKDFSSSISTTGHIIKANKPPSSNNGAEKTSPREGSSRSEHPSIKFSTLICPEIITIDDDVPIAPALEITTGLPMPSSEPSAKNDIPVATSPQGHPNTLAASSLPVPDDKMASHDNLVAETLYGSRLYIEANRLGDELLQSSLDNTIREQSPFSGRPFNKMPIDKLLNAEEENHG